MTKPDTDAYCTPKWLADLVGEFDTDPATNARSHIRAEHQYFGNNPVSGDGLALPWFGRVWLNHPYSNPMPWMKKLRAERDAGRCTESVVLAKHDHSTQWWKELVRSQALWFIDVWMFNKRINFDPPPGLKGISNNFCSSIVHHRRGGVPLNLDAVATRWTQL